MPQFDVTHFSSQIFWLLVCFGIVYILSKKLFMPRMSNIIDSRSNKIDELKVETEKLNERLLEINKNIESIRNDSIAKYSKIISNAKLESSKRRAKFIKENQTQISDLQNRSDLIINDILKYYSNNSKVAIDNLAKKILDRLISNKIN